MSFELRKAQKQKAKLKLAVVGPSGSGKTYSSLLIASGMTDWAKIAVIDTENGSADLYDGLGDYNVIQLQSPYTPERYIEAIQAAEKAGMEVIIIDSISHEWDGKGGILEMHGAMPGNSFANWAKFTPRHNRFIEAILQSTCHVICTMRAKQDTVLVEKNGKQVPEKVGLKAVTREGVEYEFTLVLDINIKHQTTSSKDRTGLFVAEPEFVVTAETGKKLKDWAEKGIDPNKPTPEMLEEVQKLLKQKAREQKVMLDFYKVDSIDKMNKKNLAAVIAKLNTYPDADVH